MKSGLIGRVHGNFSSIDTSGHPKVRKERGNELRSTINIDEETENVSGTPITTGRVAEQTQSEIESPSIDEQGRIVEGQPSLRQETISTQFASVPGEFVVIESSKHQFAFDLIGREVGAVIEPIQLNLDALASDYQDEAEFWMGGFYDHGSNAANGVTYGDNVFADPEIGEAVWGARKNQLGMDFEYNSNPVKMRITEGGYLDIYQPSEYGTLSFVRLINDIILQYEVQEVSE